MIMLGLITLVIFIMAIVTVFSLLIGAVSTVLVYGDIIVGVLIIAAIIRHIYRKYF